MRYAISHDGTFRGHGLITLELGADAARPRSSAGRRCSSRLLLPHLGALVMAPVLGAIFQADLGRLKELVETRFHGD